MILPKGALVIVISKKMRLVLGSASPRRYALLAQAGFVPDDVRTPDIDEKPHLGELPVPYAARMSTQKAEALMPVGKNELLLCADTIVACGRRILGKPQNRDEAESFLRLLSGRRHYVITNVQVNAQNRQRKKTVKTIVKIQPLTQKMIQTYLDCGEWRNKAGGYGVQGRAALFVSWISGSYSNIVGLPLYEVAHMLQSAGIKPAHCVDESRQEYAGT